MLVDVHVGLHCCDIVGSVRVKAHTLSGDVDQPVPSLWDRQIVKLITYSRRCLRFLGRAFVDMSPHVSARLLLTHLYCCSAGLAPHRLRTASTFCPCSIHPVSTTVRLLRSAFCSLVPASCLRLPAHRHTSLILARFHSVSWQSPRLEPFW